MRTSIWLALGTFFVEVNCLGQTSNDTLLCSRIDSLLGGTFKSDAPGGSVFVQEGNRVLYSKSFGLADLKSKELFTMKTVSNLGSITKTFVAYGILILQARGKLSIEDSVSKYFPDFRNKEIGGKVKIKHLLTHTSGLPDSRTVEKDSVFFLTANDEQNFAPLKNTDTLEFEPGSRWNYSNPAYNGLALIIEQVSGMKWQEFIRKNIFEPAGMSHSKITDGSYPDRDVAHAYKLEKGKYEEFDFGEYPTFCAAGNGGVWSSIEDLRKYYTAMNQGVFLSRNVIDFSKSLWHPPNWKDTTAPLNGFSWFVHEKNDSSQYKLVGHNGEQAGFTASFLTIPEKNILIIMEFNSVRPVLDYQKGIRRLLSELGYL